MANLTDPSLTDSQDQSSSSKIQEALIEQQKQQIKKEGHSSSSAQSYSVTILNTEDSDISPQMVQRVLTQSKLDLPRGLSTIIIYNAKDCSCPEDKKEEEEDVSEEFVSNYNEHIGNKEKQLKAERLLRKMEILGGLVPDTPRDQIDIPAARMGLAILAGLKNHRLKVEAMHDLQVILKDDPGEKESAIDLVHLSIKLLNRMDRELLQAEIMDVQIEIAKTYGAVAELLLHHYAKKHINAITKELKAQLTNSAKALEDLNRQEDPRLAYVVRFALEGMNRLIDDNKVLLEILQRIYNFTLAAAATACQDMPGAQPNLEAAFGEIRLHLKSSWYSAAILLHELSRNAKTNRDSLLKLQSYIAQEHKELNWRFLYEAIEILTDIAIHGKDHKIRRTAFEGIPGFQPSLPSISKFAEYKEFKQKTDMSPMLYLHAPRMKNRNITIRKLCIENLIRIANESPDREIRKEAKEALIHRLANEKKEEIREMIEKVVPKNSKKRQEWLEEKRKSVTMKSEGSDAISEKTTTSLKRHRRSQSDISRSVVDDLPGTSHSAPHITMIAQNTIDPAPVKRSQSELPIATPRV